jgi:hypothetical protein
VAEPNRTEVVDARPVDVALLSDLSTDLRPADEVGDRYERHTAVETARFAGFLGRLTSNIARREVGDDAHCAVLETTAQSILPAASSAWHCVRCDVDNPRRCDLHA